MDNKRKIGGLLAATGVVAGAVGGFGFYLFRQIIARDAGLIRFATETGFKLASKNNIEEKMPEMGLLREKAEWFEEQTLEEFTMQSADGKKLQAYFLPAKNKSNVYVFCSHGYRADGAANFSFFAKMYHDRDINVFIVDHQAAGKSEGKYIGFGAYESQDSLAWLGFMNDKFGDDIEIILHGVSMGCATVLLMTGNEALPKNVKFAIADCGYTSLKDEMASVMGRIGVPMFPLVNIVSVCTRHIAGYDIKETNVIPSMKKTEIPVLFVHGEADMLIPAYMSAQSYAACTSDDKELLIVEGANHGMSYIKEPDVYEEKLDSYLEKYVTTLK